MPKNPEVFRLLKSFSKKDFINFDKFLKSPFLNNTDALNPVFNFVKKNQYLLFNIDSNDIENLLATNLKYSRNTIKKLLSYLKNSLLKYYSLKKVLSDNNLLKIKQCEYLLDISELKFLKLSQSELEEQIYGTGKISSDTFLHSHYLNNNLYDTSISNMIFRAKKRPYGSKDYINNSATELYLYTLIQTVMLFVNLTVRVFNNLDEKYNWHSIDIDKYIESGNASIQAENNSLYKKTFNLYKKLYLTFKNIDSDKYFKSYKSYFFKNMDTFSNDIIRNHYLLLLNFCNTRERNNNKNNYYSYEWIELMEKFINFNLINNPDNPYLHNSFYRNVVLECFSLKDHKKLKNFITDFSPKLLDKDYGDMTKYAMAHYHYLVREFQKTLKCINDIKIKIFYFKYDLINLELKIYFENFNIELIERAIHNYKENVKHDTFLSALDKSRFNKLLKYYRNLVYLKEKLSIDKKYITDIYHLKNKIENETGFVMKIWMKEKVNEIISEYENKSLLKRNINI